MRPDLIGMIALGGHRIALHLVGAALHLVGAVRHLVGSAGHLLRPASHRPGDVVTDVLTFPREIVDRRIDAGPDLLILVGSPLAEGLRRISHSLPKVCGQSWNDQRQAGAGERARQQSDHEAIISRLLRVFIHVVVLLWLYLMRSATGGVFTTEQTPRFSSGMLLHEGTNMSHTTKRNAGLRRMLSERRREMQNDVQSRIRDGRTDRANDVRDDLEVSDDDIQGDLEFALLQMRAETLTRIDQALVRLDAGKYGSCFECEGEIAEPRLRALPFAVRCQACEERREQAHGRAQRHAQRSGAFSLFPEVIAS